MVTTKVSKVEEASVYQRAYESRLVTQTPEMLWGRPVFANTRVPVDALFDYLEDGESVDAFADHFGIDREVVRQFLAELQEKLFR
ncbi:MAG: DUF433 domain-containing protein [Acidobacteriota bacterium]|nr:DUF433 domain-containing protein [Acidobacteriota bacterium]